MPDKRLRALANECRERAEEILARAETFKDAGAWERMDRRAARSNKRPSRRTVAAILRADQRASARGYP